MNRIRVMVSARSRILQDILVDTIQGEADMQVVGRGRAASDLLHAIDDVEPDIVLVSAPHPGGSLEELARAETSLKVLAVVDDGRGGLIYELRPCRSLLGELSRDSLVEAIRSAIGMGDDAHPAGSA